MAQLDVDVSVLIVNYNGAELLVPCIESIFDTAKSTRVEVIVVDNASTDHSKHVLETIQYPITVVLSQVNLGFAAGNNLAAKHARGQFYFALNNDTIVLPGAIDYLVLTLKQNPNVGILGPQLLNRDQSIQGQGSVLGQFQYRSKSARVVSFLSGAAMLIPAAVYNQVGGFDENYFFYNEDVDLCKTVVKAGYDLVYDPAASVVHIGGQATATRRRESIVEGYRGGLYLCRKHYSAAVYAAYRALMLIVMSILWCLAAIWPNRKTYRLAYADVIQIILQGPIGREG